MQIFCFQVERWLRQRRVASCPGKLQKFCETGWRWVYYSTILVYGFNCLVDKPWLWNVRHCWYDYPYHKVDPDIWLYYMVELAFYWSLSFTQFFERGLPGDVHPPQHHHRPDDALLVHPLHTCWFPSLDYPRLFRSSSGACQDLSLHQLQKKL